jgi:hypothetical protein
MIWYSKSIWQFGSENEIWFGKFRSLWQFNSVWQFCLVILFGNSVQQAIDARKGIHLGRVKCKFNDLVFQINLAIWFRK